MKKVKVISAIAIVLLVINVFLVVFMIRNKPYNHSQHEPKRTIIQALHFDKNQVRDYEKLIQDHRKGIHKLEKQLVFAKKKLYSGMSLKNNVSNDSLITSIGNIHIQIEQHHYNHFLSVKTICKPNQLIYFNKFTRKMHQLFTNNRRRVRKTH
jgi:periplasmic protein CpxP/Spy